MKDRNPYADICGRRHGGNTESIDANTDTAHRKSRDRARVIDYYRLHGRLTCEEISLALDMPYTTASARISELRADGILEATPDRRQTSHGSWARVLRLAPARKEVPGLSLQGDLFGRVR